jgi:hypothetical protein
LNNIKISIRGLLILLLLSIFQSGRAQIESEEVQGSWFVFVNQHRFNTKLSALTDVQHRSWELAQNFNQLLMRSTLYYKLNSEFQLGLGYGFIVTDPSFEIVTGEKTFNEHRIHEDLLFNRSFSNGNWFNRYRLEQRYLPNENNGYDLSQRVRYMSRINYQLTSKFSISAFDEVFLNLERPVFSQNRLYFGLGYQTTPALNVQLGYMKNHFSNANFNRIVLTLWYNTSSM